MWWFLVFNLVSTLFALRYVWLWQLLGKCDYGSFWRSSWPNETLFKTNTAFSYAWIFFTRRLHSIWPTKLYGINLSLLILQRYFPRRNTSSSPTFIVVLHILKKPMNLCHHYHRITNPQIRKIKNGQLSRNYTKKK